MKGAEHLEPHAVEHFAALISFIWITKSYPLFKAVYIRVCFELSGLPSKRSYRRCNTQIGAKQLLPT